VNKGAEVKLTLRTPLLPILLVFCLILATVFPYKGWWIVTLALGLALTFSFYTISHHKEDLEIQREMRFGWATVGDVLEERIIIHNTGPIATTWLEITDHTNIPGQKQSIGTNVGAHNQTTWRTRHTCSRRGLYRLGPTTLQTSDLFGFYHLSIHDPTEVNILITPSVVPLPNIEVASGGRTGDGRLAKGVLEQSIAVSTIRDYQPQDPLHHIHWPLTAKRNELTSFVFENTPTGNWWIIQDMNKSVQIGDDTNNSLEIGIILSASLAHKGINSGKAVGFIANDSDRSWIPAQQAGDQTMKILRNLAVCEAGNIPLQELLKKSRNSFKQAASLIIITPDISMDWWHSLLWLQAKGMVPTILLLNPASFGGTNTTYTALKQLQNAGIPAYNIQADMFADQIDLNEKPLWEWRVFGTGHAVPVKKPKDTDWKRLQ
jgi:uncharacterized protein (DUF58 family)